MPYYESMFGGGIKSTTESVTTAGSGNVSITKVPVTQKLLAAFVEGSPYIALMYIAGNGQNYGVHVQDTAGVTIANANLTLRLIYTD